MSTFLEYKSAVLKLFEDSINFANNTKYTTSVDTIQKIKKEIEKNEMVIVVCGEIKRGKSSLLSAFLEEKELFPIDVNVATNTVTVVRYGEVEKIEVIYENNEKYCTKEICRSEIVEYVTEQGNKRNEKKVSCLSIELPNKKLKDGFVFVDTPGVGSLNLAHSEITYGYLPNADLLLFVSDALSPLTEPELKFLQTATKYCKNVIYPLTKIDKTSNYRNIHETNLEKISQYTDMPKMEIKMVPVSSLAKLKYLEMKNPMMLKNSNYKVLENEIWKMVYDKRAQILIVPPLTELAQEIVTIRNNLKIKYISLTQDSKNSKKLEEALQKSIVEKQRLLEEGADWRAQLSYELSTINSRVITNIRNKQTEIENLIIEFIENKDMLNNLDELTAKVNGMLGSLTLEAKDYIVENVNNIADKTEEKLGLLIAVNNNIIEKLDVELGSVDVNIKTSGRADKAIKVGRSMKMEGMGGASIVALVGGTVGGGIGFFLGGPPAVLAFAKGGALIGGAIGGAAGSGKGLYEGIKHRNDADILKIKQTYVKHSNNKLREIINSVNSTIKELSFVLPKELNNRIKTQKIILDKNINDIQENLKLSKTETIQSANSMKPLFDMLSTIETRINQLMKVTVIEKKKTVNIQSRDKNPYEIYQQTNNTDTKDKEKVCLDFLEE